MSLEKEGHFLLRRKKIIVGIVILLILGAVIFSMWYLQPYPATEEVESVLSTAADDSVRFSDEHRLVFEPIGREITTGVIFYPGAKVEPEAYAPLLKQISEAGYLAVIVPMPLNLAVFGSGRAGDVMDEYSYIEDWYLAGHSLGGAMAARYASKNVEQLTGLILLASYPARSDDLSDSGLEVLSVYATEDGYTSVSRVEESEEHLPEDTQWVKIRGGNHSQFGYYGFQPRDLEAEIGREKQQQVIITAVKEFLK